MQEDHVGRALIQWLEAVLETDVPNLYTHTPAQVAYPYGEFSLSEVKKNPGEKRVAVQFSVTLFSQYRGQKELLEISAKVRSKIENNREGIGVFRLKSINYKQENDNITRKSELEFMGLISV